MITDHERERRLNLVQTEVLGDQLDALIVCGRDDLAGSEQGRLRYLTGLEFVSGHCFVVITKDGTTVLCVPAHVGRAFADEGSWIEDVHVDLRAVEGVIRTIQESAPPAPRLGVVGLSDLMTVEDYKRLNEAIPNTVLSDATGPFDAIRAVKSDEEIACIRETAAILDRAFSAMAASLAPGMSERVATSEMWRVLKLHGCQGGFLNVARSGGITAFHSPTDELISKDDILGFDLEYRGPSGYAVELTRYFSFGKPPADMQRIYDIQVGAFRSGLDVLRPGSAYSEVLQTLRDYYRGEGYELAGPVGWGSVMYQVHGIGLDFMELPYIPGSEGVLPENTVVAFHPRLGPEDPSRLDITVLDNVLVAGARGQTMTYPEPVWTVL